MSASETVSLVFEAEIGQLRKALEGIPGISAKEAKKITASHLAALRATEAAAKKAASATAKAAEKQAAAAAKVADEAREGLLELGDAAGLSKDVVEKLSKGMAVLNNPATLAAAAFGAMALAAVGAGVAMVSLVRAGAEAEVGVQQRYEKWGGIPRYVLGKLDKDSQELLARATTRIYVDALLRDLDKGEIESDAAVSHRLVHLKPAGERADGSFSDPHSADSYLFARSELGSTHIVEAVLRAAEWERSAPR